jgi:hypothetical protein
MAIHAMPAKLATTPNACVAECAISSRAEYALTIASLPIRYGVVYNDACITVSLSPEWEDENRPADT